MAAVKTSSMLADAVLWSAGCEQAAWWGVVSCLGASYTQAPSATCLNPCRRQSIHEESVQNLHDKPRPFFWPRAPRVCQMICSMLHNCRTLTRTGLFLYSSEKAFAISPIIVYRVTRTVPYARVCTKSGVQGSLVSAQTLEISRLIWYVQ